MFYEPSTKKKYQQVIDFQMEYRNTSFCGLDTTEEQERSGLYVLHEQRPIYDSKLQEITPGAVVEIKGKWTQTYQVTEKVLSRDQRFVIFNNRFTAALTALFDTTANQKQYDTAGTCVMRAGYPGPYQEEAQAFGTWMDTCNSICYPILNEMITGSREIPTDFTDGIKEILDQLPKLDWDQLKK